MSEQHFGMEIAGAIGSQEIAQVEGERRIGNAVAVEQSREGRAMVPPALVFRRLEKEKVDPIGRGGAVCRSDRAARRKR